ncbi:MAG: hypothetical protein H6649_03405 [Caldilineae bacterium]|nr:hypothetical protein [Caldilineae bacterium]
MPDMRSAAGRPANPRTHPLSTPPRVIGDPRGTPDGDAAVAAASRRSTAGGAPATTSAQRCCTVTRLVHDHSDELSRLLTMEEGNRCSKRRRAGLDCQHLHYYAGLGHGGLRVAARRSSPVQLHDQGAVRRRRLYRALNYLLLLLPGRLRPRWRPANRGHQTVGVYAAADPAAARLAFAHLPPGVVNVVAATGRRRASRWCAT